MGGVTYPTVGGSPGGNSGAGSAATGWTDVTGDLYYSGGHLGTLKIPAIGLSTKVYQGTGSSVLAKGAGHFLDTSIWAGNVCIAGHNRGVRDDFGDLHTLEPGDTAGYPLTARSRSPATRHRKPTTPRKSRRIQTGSWPASLLTKDSRGPA